MATKRVLITGAAGFIGFHLARFLQKCGHHVVGLDNFNDYYPQSLKKDRAAILAKEGIEVHEGDINEKGLLLKLCDKGLISHFVHLAAYAGVRYSMKAPEVYLRNNIDGFFQVLETIRERPNTKLVYASSSSVYGANQKVPFAVVDPTSKPANIYGMTKKTNELMAFSYHHIHNITTVGLRFFTVYGSWGRPDMAYYHFTRSLFEGKPIDLYNFGNMWRDFTHVSDIVAGISASLELEKGYHLFNLGNNKRVSLIQFVELIEKAAGKKVQKNLLPMPAGEMVETYADISESQKILGFTPQMPLEEGLKDFVCWFRDYHKTSIT